MTRVLATATVDQLAPRQFEVSVIGEPPHDHRRTYTLEASTEDRAAMDGLRLFVDEMENLPIEGERWQGAAPNPVTPTWIDGNEP